MYLCSKNMEETIISSVQNARIKHVVALQQKSSLRREEGLFVVEGQREIEHCIACGYEVVEMFSRDVECGARPNEMTTFVTPQVYEKMAYRGSTEGMIAVARCKDHSLSSFLISHSSFHQKTTPLIVVLESVEKPGNLGAILRTAEAAGVDHSPAARLLRLLRLRHAGSYSHRDGDRVNRSDAPMAQGCRCPYPNTHVGAPRLSQRQCLCRHPHVRGCAPKKMF